MTKSDIESRLLGTRRMFKKSATLIFQGEAPRCGFYIVKGVVKSYTLSSDGSEQLTAFYKTGDFLPLPWLLRQTSRASYFYDSLTLVESIAVTPEDMDSLLKDITIQEHILRKQAADLTLAMLRITSLEQSRARDKILFTLYYLLGQFGVKKNETSYEIKLKLTHALIASLVGLTRETTAVEMNMLKSKKIVDYSQSNYVVNKSLLESFMGEDSFRELI